MDRSISFLAESYFSNEKLIRDVIISKTEHLHNLKKVREDNAKIESIILKILLE